MALQTKTFTEGSTESSALNYYALDLMLTEESINVVDNTSVVSFVLQLRSSGYHYFSGYRIGSKVVLGGTVVASQAMDWNYQYSIGANSTLVLQSGSTTVKHNSNGTLDLSVEFSIEIADDGRTPGNVSVTGKSWSLTTIPRASSFRASDANIESTSVISIQTNDASFKHSLHYSFGSLSGYINSSGDHSDTEVTLSGTALWFDVPASFYGQIPSAPSGICTLTLQTYSGSTKIGDPQTAQFKATADPEKCRPIVSGTVVDINAATIALTGDANVLVRGRSIARCTISATAKNGASIAQKKIAGAVVSGTDRDIANVETGSFLFQATDGRGYPGEATVQKSMVPYILLTNNASGARTDPTSGNAVLTLKGKCYKGSFGAAENTLSIRYSLNGGAAAEVTDMSWDNGEYSAEVALSGLDYQQSHSIEVVVEDALESVSKTVIINQGIPVFDWGRDYFNFNVPVNFKGGLDFAYPVGSIYMSVKDTDPGTLFGGTWERLKDRFLLAAGDSYGAGATGGEAAVALTINEMPGHTHTAATGSAGSHTHKIWGYLEAGKDGSYNVADAYTERSQSEADIQNDPAGDHTHTVTVSSAGGGQAHNNMPPYLTVYMWKRTA